LHLCFFMQASWTDLFRPILAPFWDPRLPTTLMRIAGIWLVFGVESGTSCWAKDPWIRIQCPVGGNPIPVGLRPNQTDSPTGSLWWSFHGTKLQLHGSLLPTSKHTKHFNFFYPSLQLLPFGYFIAFHFATPASPCRPQDPHSPRSPRSFPRRLLCQITYTPLTFYALVLSQLNF